MFHKKKLSSPLGIFIKRSKALGERCGGLAWLLVCCGAGAGAGAGCVGSD